MDSRLPLYEEFEVKNRERIFEIKESAEKMVTFLRNNDVDVYSNRMYASVDGQIKIPVAKADSYDKKSITKINKKGKKIRKMLKRNGFSGFHTDYEVDKVIQGGILWLIVDKP